MSFDPSKIYVVYDKNNPCGFIGRLYVNYSDAEASIDVHVDEAMKGRRIRPENAEKRRTEVKRSMSVVSVKEAMELTIDCCSSYHL